MGRNFESFFIHSCHVMDVLVRRKCRVSLSSALGSKVSLSWSYREVRICFILITYFYFLDYIFIADPMDFLLISIVMLLS